MNYRLWSFEDMMAPMQPPHNFQKALRNRIKIKQTYFIHTYKNNKTQKIKHDQYSSLPFRQMPILHISANTHILTLFYFINIILQSYMTPVGECPDVLNITFIPVNWDKMPDLHNTITTTARCFPCFTNIKTKARGRGVEELVVWNISNTS